MKLQHIPIGGRFEYEGKVFVKTGPLTAASEQGGQCMIPRYAILRSLDQPVMDGPPGLRRKIDEATVRSAFEVFYRDCSQLLEPSAQQALDVARQQFFNTLKI